MNPCVLPPGSPSTAQSRFDVDNSSHVILSDRTVYTCSLSRVLSLFLLLCLYPLQPFHTSGVLRSPLRFSRGWSQATATPGRSPRNAGLTKPAHGGHRTHRSCLGAWPRTKSSGPSMQSTDSVAGTWACLQPAPPPPDPHLVCERPGTGDRSFNPARVFAFLGNSLTAPRASALHL